MSNAHTTKESAAPETKQEQDYERPEVKTLSQRDIVQAVAKGSKFPARGFAG